MGTNLSRNFWLLGWKASYSHFCPMMISMSSFLFPEAFIASFAPLRMIQLCFSPKAASYALHNISGMVRFGSLIYSKVTRMKVNSHIILSRFLAVELYFLYSLGAFLELLLSPL
jgi:hypothetical protein